MRTIERNGESELEQKLLTPASRGNGIKTDVVVVVVPNKIESICKIFADDRSLFSKVKIKLSDIELNNYLNKISKWAFQWKISFNPDPSKQAMAICFSHKRDNEDYPSLVFNPFVPNASFLCNRKPYGFLMYSGVRERVHWKRRVITPRYNVLLARINYIDFRFQT